jgi:hypothetical protein
VTDPVLDAIEIIFHTASRPKVHQNTLSVYTKGGLLCVELDDEEQTIMKYPLCNVFSVAQSHKPHRGTTKHS